MNVEYKQQKFLLDLYVVKTKGPVLMWMGRDWLNRIRLDWKTIKSLRVGGASTPDVEQRLQNLLNLYSDVFEDKLGTLKSAKASLTLKEGGQLRFCKARQVPILLETQGGGRAETTSEPRHPIQGRMECEWVTPIAQVPKKNGCVECIS